MATLRTPAPSPRARLASKAPRRAARAATRAAAAAAASNGNGAAPRAPPGSGNGAATPAADPRAGRVSFAAGAGRVGAAFFADAAAPAGAALGAPPRPNLQARLAAAGLAGVASYGLLNTLYYTVAFLLVWATVGKPPGAGRGAAAAAAAVAKAVGIVWVASQPLKAPRAGAALLLAPAVDRLLGWLAARLRLPSKRAAFFRAVVPACWALAGVLFGGTVLLWA